LGKTKCSTTYRTRGAELKYTLIGSAGTMQLAMPCHACCDTGSSGRAEIHGDSGEAICMRAVVMMDDIR
jgi:hypothetical protein